MPDLIAMRHACNQLLERFFFVRSKPPIGLALTGPDKDALVPPSKAMLRVAWPTIRLGTDIEIPFQDRNCIDIYLYRR